MILFLFSLMLLLFFSAIFSGLKTAFKEAKQSAKKERAEKLGMFLSDLRQSSEKVRQGEFHTNGEFNGAYPSAKANLNGFRNGDFNRRYFS